MRTNLGKSDVAKPVASFLGIDTSQVVFKLDNYKRKGVVAPRRLAKWGQLEGVGQYDESDPYRLYALMEVVEMGLPAEYQNATWHGLDSLPPNERPQFDPKRPNRKTGLAYVVERIRDGEKWFFHLTVRAALTPEGEPSFTYHGHCTTSAEPHFVRSVTRRAIVLPLHILLSPLIPHVDAYLATLPPPPSVEEAERDLDKAIGDDGEAE